MVNLQLARTINGTHTEILIQSYADRVLVLVTQLSKVGCLIQATLPATQPLIPPLAGNLPPPPPSVVLTPLLGQPPTPHLYTLYNLYAAQTATLIWNMEEAAGLTSPAGRLPVIVGVALKQSTVGNGPADGVTEEQRELFREIMDMIKKCYGSTSVTVPAS